MLKKIILKLKSDDGISVSLENLIFMIIGMALLVITIAIFGILHTEYKLNNFASELMRTAELTGYVGETTKKREKELQQALSIEPRVTWSKEGKIGLNETIKVECVLDYKVKIPFWNVTFRIKRNDVGRSEIFWK